MHGRFRRPGPAVVLAFIALFAALGGTSYAAIKISGKNVKDSSLTGKDIKNKSLSASDFKGSVRGRQGPRGLSGPQGPQGPVGPTALGQLGVVDSAQVPFGPTDIVQGAIAFCPAGQRVVSGGGISITDEELAASEALANRAGWFVIGVDLSDDGGEYIQAQALCAPAGAAVAASAGSLQRQRTLRSGAREQVAALEADIRSQRPAAKR